jgi:hypothetical protein
MKIIKVVEVDEGPDEIKNPLPGWRLELTPVTLTQSGVTTNLLALVTVILTKYQIF